MTRHTTAFLLAALVAALPSPALGQAAATGRQTVSDLSQLPVTAKDVDGTSVARSAKTRFENLVTHTKGFVSVLDYGAKGDGTTDDTAAFNSAGAEGQPVRVPPGTYKLTGTVSLAAGAYMSAPQGGATLNFTGAPDSSLAAIRLDGAGAGVEGITINVTAGDYRRTIAHRAPNTYTRRNTIAHTTNDIPAPAGDWTTGNAAYVIFASMSGSPSLTGVVVEENDVTLKNVPWGDGVQTSYAPGIVVRRNTFHDFTYDSSTAADIQHFWGTYISRDTPGAVVEGNTYTNLPGGGIHFNDVSAATAVGQRVINNRVSGIGFAGILVEMTTGTIVSGNWVSSCDLPILVSSTSSSVVVTTNRVETVVSASTPLSSDKPLIGSSAPGTTIAGNVFGARGTGVTGLAVYGANTIVSGNTFNTDRPRIAVLVNGTDSVVTGNAIATTTDSTGAATINVAAARAVVAGNTMTLPTTAGFIGIRMSSDDNRLTGNSIIGAATSVFVASGNRNVLSENTYSGFGSTSLLDSGTGTITSANVTNGAMDAIAAISTVSGLTINGNAVVDHTVIASTGNSLDYKGRVPDGGGYVAHRFGNTTTMATTGEKACEWYSDSAFADPVASIRFNGTRWGLRLRSPDGTWYLCTVANGGALSCAANP